MRYRARPAIRCTRLGIAQRFTRALVQSACPIWSACLHTIFEYLNLMHYQNLRILSPSAQIQQSHSFSRHEGSRNLFLSRFSSQRRGKPPSPRLLWRTSADGHRHSPVPIREAKEVQPHTMKAPNPRYECSLNLLGHTSLT
jgi:hypothetical protein